MNECPKCDSTDLYKNPTNKTIKCKSCNHINYKDKFFIKESQPQDILSTLGVGTCWLCKSRIKLTELRNFDDVSMCTECFSPFSKMVTVVVRGLQ